MMGDAAGEEGNERVSGRYEANGRRGREVVFVRMEDVESCFGSSCRARLMFRWAGARITP